MAGEQRAQDDKRKALERPSPPAAAAPGRPPVKPSPATARADDPFPTIAPGTLNPVPPQPPRRRPGKPRTEPPRYRCLRCGYLLADTTVERCSECGWQIDPERLADWYLGDEEQRFARAVWFVLACLFTHLLALLPPLCLPARVATAFLVAWAGVVGRSGKQGSVGSYYGIAAMVAGGIMLLMAAAASSLTFYTADAIGGCLVLLTMLHDANGTPLGVARGSRMAALALLFVTPAIAVACYTLESAAPPAGWTSLFPAPYTPFGFVAPGVLAVGVWAFAWRTLAGVQHILFRQQDL
jgi:ribosomal protein L37E